MLGKSHLRSDVVSQFFGEDPSPSMAAAQPNALGLAEAGQARSHSVSLPSWATPADHGSCRLLSVLDLRLQEKPEPIISFLVERSIQTNVSASL
jgi:hypothetical protein